MIHSDSFHTGFVAAPVPLIAVERATRPCLVATIANANKDHQDCWHNLGTFVI